MIKLFKLNFLILNYKFSTDLTYRVTNRSPKQNSMTLCYFPIGFSATLLLRTICMTKFLHQNFFVIKIIFNFFFSKKSLVLNISM